MKAFGKTFWTCARASYRSRLDSLWFEVEARVLSAGPPRAEGEGTEGEKTVPGDGPFALALISDDSFELVGPAPSLAELLEAVLVAQVGENLHMIRAAFEEAGLEVEAANK